MPGERQQIIDTAIDLFAERGIANVSVAELARTISASRGKIYYHFRNGMPDIVASIIDMIEDYSRSKIPNTNVWSVHESDVTELLQALFFQYPVEESARFRKIARIVMTEMCHNTQIANQAIQIFITRREEQLAALLRTLVDCGRIAPLDVDCAARFFNRQLLVCAIEDVIRYPYASNEEDTKKANVRAVRDCANFINYLISETR